MKQSVKNEIIAKSAVGFCKKLWDIIHSEKVNWTSDNVADFKETLWVISQLVESEKDFQRFINNIKEEQS